MGIDKELIDKLLGDYKGPEDLIGGPDPLIYALKADVESLGACLEETAAVDCTPALSNGPHIVLEAVRFPKKNRTKIDLNILTIEGW
jgi:hypothetical protein